MKKYNIVFATDQNYIQHLVVALKSLLENNKEQNFKIYIINGGIEKFIFSKVKRICLDYNAELQSIVIDDLIFKNLVTNHHFTKANYYRLLIPNFIDDEKVLYLDADIVVNSSIKELYNFNFDDKYICAVLNLGFTRHKELKMSLSSEYFNSGVMLINNEKWKKDNISDQVVSFVDNNRENIKFVDQCGLNAIINGRWKKIPLKYNQQAAIFEDNFERKYHNFSSQELNEAKENPIIVHYTGSSKPWHFMNKHPYKKLYWKYLKMTPFKRIIPEDLTIINIIKWLTPDQVKKFIKEKMK